MKMNCWKKKMRHTMKTLTSRKFLFIALGCLLLITGWHVLSLFMHSIVIASPYDAFSSLYEILGTERFQGDLWITTKRIFMGIFWGGLAGFILGLLAGIKEDIKNLLEPMRWALMSVPPIVVVVLAMLWFGMGSTMVVFISGLIILPVVYVNTVKGIEMVDKGLLEMAWIYKLSLWLRLKHIYIPAITGPLIATVAIVIGQGVRVVIMAEILGASDGIGNAMSIASATLEIPELFAYVIVAICIVGITEFLLFRPIQDYVLRWKG
jgi:NitT/TauT family transport system permease protein